jgi:flagellar biosynthesis/type III secretory pathway chaperone
MTDSSKQAALSCFAHLEHEEAMLRETLEMLQAIRLALLKRNLARLSDVLQHQQRVVHAAAELRTARDRLRQSLGAELGVSGEETTLSALAAQLDEPMRGQLLGRQKKLSEMAREVHFLNHGNALLVRQSMDMLQQLFDSLTGNQGVPRYTADGQIDRGERGSTFQTRC